MSAARSASPLLIAVVVLTGCTTTQEVNGRLELRAQRVLAGREPVRVTEANPDVAVVGAWAIRGKAGAIVVELTNKSDAPLTDLPISVGVEDAKGKRTYLNERRGLEYFQTRVAAVAPGATVRWVYSSKRDIGKGEPFAVVGSQDEPHADAVSVLPKLEAAGEAADGRVRVKVTNATDIPQYNLPVYALLRSEGRYVAAGRTRIEELDDRSTSSVAIRLTGATAGEVELEALPTIFK